MKLEIKKKFTFAIIMGIITTSIISFSLTTINIGFKQHFIIIWMRSWLISYLIAVPLIIFIGPKIQREVNNFFETKNKIY